VLSHAQLAVYEDGALTMLNTIVDDLIAGRIVGLDCSCSVDGCHAEIVASVLWGLYEI
jgi:hypothetical protein